MIDSLTIDDVARRTGLSARALRFYEARGLVAPLRTASGRRCFGPGELERVHRIVALKRAGLSLGDIKRLFDRKPVDLIALLTAQLVRLQQQAREVADATALIDSALSRIGRGEPLDAATLCSLIRDGDMTMTEDANRWKAVLDRYYTPEEQAEWKKRMPPETEFGSESEMAKWRDLSSRIEAALPLDPASIAALGFVREWFALLEPFSRAATPEMWKQSRNLYAHMDEWQGQADAGFSKRVWDFINLATTAQLSAGKDVGPLPAFIARP